MNYQIKMVAVSESEFQATQKLQEVAAGCELVLQMVQHEIQKYSKYKDLTLRVIRKREQLKKILEASNKIAGQYNPEPKIKPQIEFKVGETVLYLGEPAIINKINGSEICLNKNSIITKIDKIHKID